MLRAHKGEIPILYWLLPFIAGIILQVYFTAAGWLQLAVDVFTVSCPLFIGLNIFYNALKLYRHMWIGGVVMHLFLLCAGWLCSYWHNGLNDAEHFARQKANYLIVQVNSEPVQKGIYTRFVASVKRTGLQRKLRPATGKLLVTLVADSNTHLVKYGDQLLIPANYKVTDQPFNPAEFNYKRYLAHQNIYHQSFISRLEFKKLQQQTGNTIIAYSLAVRQHLVKQIGLYFYDAGAAAIASTLLLGYKADLSDEVLQAYSKTGTINVLSVSGAHVAVFFWLITLLLKPFGHYRYGKLLNALLSLTLIWGYAILTGLSPAVCRAALMLSMIIVSKASGRPVHALNALAASAFALLLYDPFLLTDVGFQLSYLAVFGLVVFQPIIYEQFNFRQAYAQKLWYACSASLAAQLITFPLSAYYFHQFPVYFLVSNLLIMLPAEGIVLIGLTFLLCTYIPGLSVICQALSYLLEHLILLMNKLLTLIEQWPYATISRIWLSPWQHLVLWLLVLAFIYLILYKRSRELSILLVGALILCTAFSWRAIQSASEYRMVFFNVKKNSAILFQKGNQAVVLTDLKEKDKNYQYSIQPCLDSLGVDSTVICNANQNLQLPYFKKQMNYVQFVDKSVLLINTALHKTWPSQKVSVDYLFFTHNPHVNLRTIKQNFNFKYFIADANNSIQRLHKLKAEGDSMNLKINFLKRNNCFIVASKY
ncbi:ComEC/Rec2 family competence protein [Mucilaginibacter sp. PAMB04168]|uniref:ComEC/Rec2 family competence protein n=1 Tax=Mucilaginibacter sp. PAMB04168 TaxID=3138567 RepID=UPI0031F6F297